MSPASRNELEGDEIKSLGGYEIKSLKFIRQANDFQPSTLQLFTSQLFNFSTLRMQPSSYKPCRQLLRGLRKRPCRRWEEKPDR